MIFKLVEKTHGPWMGRVWRCEEMTEQEAQERNLKISVMQWEKSEDEQFAKAPRRSKRNRSFVASVEEKCAGIASSNFVRGT